MDFLQVAVNFGLSFAIACAAVTGMMAYVRMKEKQTREDMVTLQRQATASHKFIQDTLVGLVAENNTIVSHCTEIITNLTRSVEARTCVAMGLISQNDRDEIEAIFRRSQDE